jgi:hypothetical protein
VSEVKELVSDQGFDLREVTQLRSNKTSNNGSRPLPMFLVQLGNNEESKKIFDLKQIYGLKVSVESFVATNGPAQCYRCQQFGHSSKGCFVEPRCLKCSGKHLSRECKATEASNFVRKCANCGGQHCANYRGCEAFKAAKAKMVQKTRRQAPPNPDLAKAMGARTFQSRPVTPGRSFSDALKNASPNDGGAIPPAPPVQQESKPQRTPKAPRPKTAAPTPQPAAAKPLVANSVQPRVERPKVTPRLGAPASTSAAKPTADHTGPLDGLSDLLALVRGFDLSWLIGLLKSTAAKVVQAPDAMSKLLVLGEALVSVISHYG